MAQEEFPNEYGNLNEQEVSKDLESFTNTASQKQEKKHVRTFAKDVAEQMKSNSASVVKVALAEQGRQREYETIVKKSKKEQIIFLVFTFVFVVGGAVLLATSLKNRQNTIPLNQPIQQEKTNALIFSESQEILNSVDLSRSELIETFHQRAEFIKAQGITNIIFVLQNEMMARAMTGSEFLTLLGTNIPETLPSLMKDDFMVGIDGNNNFAVFIMFSFDNFDSVVSLLREWEPFFIQDMVRIMNIQTSGQGIEIFSKSFDSEILFNKESRVLRDQNQGFVAGYTFLDRNTVVMSTNLETIQEVINRYTIQKIQ